MQSNQIITRLIEELNLIPDQQLSQLYDMIHSYRIVVTSNKNCQNKSLNQIFMDLNSKGNFQTFASIENGYKAMARDSDYEKEASEWLFDECGECLPDNVENWDGWNE